MMELFDNSIHYSNHREFMSVVVEQLCVRSMVEVGVLDGALSTAILANCPQIKDYYLVDPWQPFTASDHPQEVWDKRYENVIAKMKLYEGKANILRLASIEAAGLFEPESLDLGFIDANHSFPYVDEDIRTWWSKIKPTGYLAGHDIGDQRWPGVLRAVEANFGKQYYCGKPTDNWGWVWIVSKKVHKKRER